MDEPLENNADKVSKQEKEIIPIREIMDAVRSIKHGSVQIIIQDSRIVQIDKVEKIRLDKKGGEKEKGNSMEVQWGNERKRRYEYEDQLNKNFRQADQSTGGELLDNERSKP